MITIERAARLAEVPLFARMDATTLARVAELAEELIVPADSTIFSGGDVGDALFLIVEGRVRIHHDSQVLSSLGPSEHFGEMSLLDGAPRSASATAEEDCMLLRLERSAFEELLATHHEASLAVMRTLTSRLREMDEMANG